MRAVPLIALWFLLGTHLALAEPQTETEGPLSPCVAQGGADEVAASDQSAQTWGVEIATSFSKEDALDQFNRAKQDYADVLGTYEPIIVTSCDLHMGTDLQYSARIGMDSREDADALCAKIRTAGGACVVQKN
jgi:hypothetical protein